MFVQQLDMEEFRGVKKCQEPIKFSRFNVLIGRNNSGKSTILQAMSMLPLPYGPNIPFIGPSHSPLSKKDFVIELTGGTSSLVYMYSGSAKISYLIDDRRWEVMLDETGRMELSIENIKSPYDRTQIAKLLNVTPTDMTIQKMVFYIPDSTRYIKTLIEKLIEEDVYWGLVVKRRAHIEIARYLSECIDDKYTEVLIYKNALCGRKELPKTGPFYIKLEDLGDGVEKSIAAMLFITALNPDIILWDDFEAAAHPTLIKILLQWLNQQRQVVLSTHSIDVLARLLEVKPKDAKIIQLRKTADDILLHKELSLEELEAIMEANQDPRLLVDALQL